MSSHPRLKLLPDGPYIEIDGGSLYLGRDCHLAQQITELTSKVVSSRHLRIVRGQDGWLLEDLGSTNGTWVRGERIAQPLRLTHGDRFRMGKGGPQWQWDEPARTTPREPRHAVPVAAPSAAGTMAEGDEPPDAEQTFRLNEQADGSGERPFRAGRTPTIVLKHVPSGRALSAEGYTIVIGRDPKTAQIVVRSPEERHVSARHAEIRFRSNTRFPMLADLGSSNGTWVNDRRVKAEVELHPGDAIVLGAAATTLKVMKIDA